MVAAQKVTTHHFVASRATIQAIGVLADKTAQTAVDLETVGEATASPTVSNLVLLKVVRATLP